MSFSGFYGFDWGVSRIVCFGGLCFYRGSLMIIRNFLQLGFRAYKKIFPFFFGGGGGAVIVRFSWLTKGFGAHVSKVFWGLLEVAKDSDVFLQHFFWFLIYLWILIDFIVKYESKNRECCYKAVNLPLLENLPNFRCNRVTSNNKFPNQPVPILAPHPLFGRDPIHDFTTTSWGRKGAKYDLPCSGHLVFANPTFIKHFQHMPLKARE